MQPGSITIIIEAVACTVIVMAGLTGKLIAGRSQNTARSLSGLILAAIAFNVVILLAVHPLAAKIGPIVTRQALLFCIMATAPLLGGFIAGVAQRQGQPAVAYSAFVVSCLLIGFVLTAFIGRANDVLGLAKDVGLLQSGQRYEPEKNKDCPENLKSLYIALQMYARDWDALPPPAGWMDNDELVSKVSRNEWLHCPSDSNRHDANYGYAYNDAVAGLKLNGKHNLADLPNAAKTPLLYDSINLTKSAHDALKSLPKPGRHGGRNNILYLDGHVQAIAP